MGEAGQAPAHQPPRWRNRSGASITDKQAASPEQLGEVAVSESLLVTEREKPSHIGLKKSDGLIAPALPWEPQIQASHLLLQEHCTALQTAELAVLNAQHVRLLRG